MQEDILDIVKNLHMSNIELVFAGAGAGIKAIDSILSVPGASNTVLEIIIPYSNSSLDSFLGLKPEKYVSSRTAELMAEKAYYRALELKITSSKTMLGVSVTATLPTYYNKKGEIKAYMAIWHSMGLIKYEINFPDQSLSRNYYECLISNYVIKSINNFHNNSEEDLELKDIIVNIKKYKNSFQALSNNHIKSILIDANSKTMNDYLNPKAILSGSFNPLHKGHIELYKLSKKLYGQDVFFEMSISNVDKLNLLEEEVNLRVAQFENRFPIIITNSSKFNLKSKLFQGSDFIIGIDTAIRLFDKKYYQNDQKLMYKSIMEIYNNGCKFLVAGRKYNGHFVNLNDINIDKCFKEIFLPINESEFREDISSSEIRDDKLI